MRLTRDKRCYRAITVTVKANKRYEYITLITTYPTKTPPKFVGIYSFDVRSDVSNVEQSVFLTHDVMA